MSSTIRKFQFKKKKFCSEKSFMKCFWPCKNSLFSSQKMLAAVTNPLYYYSKTRADLWYFPTEAHVWWPPSPVTGSCSFWSCWKKWTNVSLSQSLKGAYEPQMTSRPVHLNTFLYTLLCFFRKSGQMKRTRFGLYSPPVGQTRSLSRSNVNF